jgi:hypothetical protein
MALSAHTARRVRRLPSAGLGYGTILTAAVVYDGALLEWTAAHKLQPISNSTTAAFAGVAFIKDPTSTGGITGDGTKTVEFFADAVEILLPCNSDVTVGLVNVATIYAQDDDTVTADNTLGPAVGVCVGKDPGGTSGSLMWIRIRGNALVRAS